MYNLTNITDNANNIYEIAKATNDLSGGLYFTMMFLVLFFVYLIAFKKQNFKEVLVAGSFFMVFIAVIMWLANFVSSDFLIMPVIIFLASLVIYYFIKE